jgi:THO complex subunit 2
MDADFCVQFVRVMHLQGTPGFWTLTCYDRVNLLLAHLGGDFSGLPPSCQLLGDHVKNIVFSCSEYEARNYGIPSVFFHPSKPLTVTLGRFLLGLLTDLLKWHQDEQQYLQDNRVKGAGKAAYLPGLQLRWTNKPTVAVSDLAKWSEVQQFNRKCHRKLAKVLCYFCFRVSPRLIMSTLPQALIDCIETGEFMHVYNAIIVLKEVLPVFPVGVASGTAGYSLVTVLDKLLEKEERGDLKILARAYHASLKKRESIWAMSTDHKSGHVPMKADSPARTSTPSGPSQDSRSGGQGSNPPSAPRSHISGANNGIVAPVQPKANQSLNPTKAAIESIPRPDFIKRVGRDKMDTTPDHPSTLEVNKPGTPQPREPPTGPAKLTPPTQPRRGSPVNAADARRDHMRDQSRPPSPSGTSYPPSARDHSPRGHRGPDEWRESPQLNMPPPTIPSQKPSAQELRETAKMTMGSRLPDKPDADKSSSQYDQNGHPPRRRSNSPSRPGTRNPSTDSRGSGGQSRSAGEDERRDSRPGPSRRESGRMERGARDRASGRDGRESDREDRERERDRHGERERKERDRNERDKDRERERERERDRERERERERDRDRNGGRDSRDRHRRDERDRKERPAARESAREQRESVRGEPTTVAPAAPMETPTRPSDPPSRHRSTTKGEDGLGKRRRPADDDVSVDSFHFASPSQLMEMPLA